MLKEFTSNPNIYINERTPTLLEYELEKIFNSIPDNAEYYT